MFIFQDHVLIPICLQQERKNVKVPQCCEVEIEVLTCPVQAGVIGHPIKLYFYLLSMENKFISIRRPKDILFIIFLISIQSKNEICLDHITVKSDFYKNQNHSKIWIFFFLDKETYSSLQKTVYLTLKSKIFWALASVCLFQTANWWRAILFKWCEDSHVVWIH